MPKIGQGKMRFRPKRPQAGDVAPTPITWNLVKRNASRNEGEAAIWDLTRALNGHPAINPATSVGDHIYIRFIPGLAAASRFEDNGFGVACGEAAAATTGVTFSFFQGNPNLYRFDFADTWAGALVFTRNILDNLVTGDSSSTGIEIYSPSRGVILDGTETITIVDDTPGAAQLTGIDLSSNYILASAAANTVVGVLTGVGDTLTAVTMTNTAGGRFKVIEDPADVFTIKADTAMPTTGDFEGNIAGTVRNITGITKANPAVVTYTGATLAAAGGMVRIIGAAGMTELNKRSFWTAGATAQTFQLVGENSTGYGTYTGGGQIVLEPAYLGVPFYTVTVVCVAASATITKNFLIIEKFADIAPTGGTAETLPTTYAAFKTAMADDATAEIDFRSSTGVMEANENSEPTADGKVDFTILGHPSFILKDTNLRIRRGSNFIVKDMAFRPGNEALGTDLGNRDACRISSGENGKLENCSVSWGVDEGLEVYNVIPEYKLPYCRGLWFHRWFIGEPLWNAGNPDTPPIHPFNALVAGAHKWVIFTECVFLGGTLRNPVFSANFKGVKGALVQNCLQIYGSGGAVGATTTAGEGGNTPVDDLDHTIIARGNLACPFDDATGILQRTGNGLIKYRDRYLRTQRVGKGSYIYLPITGNYQNYFIDPVTGGDSTEFTEANVGTNDAGDPISRTTWYSDLNKNVPLGQSAAPVGAHVHLYASSGRATTNNGAYDQAALDNIADTETSIINYEPFKTSDAVDALLLPTNTREARLTLLKQLAGVAAGTTGVRTRTAGVVQIGDANLNSIDLLMLKQLRNAGTINRRNVAGTYTLGVG